MKIDLHTHSTASDGTDSPAILLAKAKAAGLDVIALTDHDTDLGWSEAIKYLPAGLTLTLGSEFSGLDATGNSVHILGLLFDNEHPNIQRLYAQVRSARYSRLAKMIEMLSDDGFEISLERVLDLLPENATIGRPHIADYLVKHGYVKDRNEAFATLLGNSSKYYLAHEAPRVTELIETIKAAGGVSILAHPRSTWPDFEVFLREIEVAAKAGLDGVEVDHRDQDSLARAEILAVANDLNLLPTGSSDYHGNGKLNKLGENTTDVEVFKALEARATQRSVIRK